MDDSKVEKDLKPTKGDLAHTLAKAGLASIPVVGGAASGLFSAIIIPPLSKRRDEWIAQIVEGLNKLEQKVEGFKIEDLSKNDTFITTVTHATNSAIRNHQAEKLEALRNAVLNSALPSPIEEDLQLMFIHFIDELRPWHLRVLKFFKNPKSWGRKHKVTWPGFAVAGGSPSKILEIAFQELKGRHVFYDQLAKDLYSRGLMNTDSLHTTMTEAGMFTPRITDIGTQFINFITSPLEQVENSS